MPVTHTKGTDIKDDLTKDITKLFSPISVTLTIFDVINKPIAAQNTNQLFVEFEVVIRHFESKDANTAAMKANNSMLIA